MKESIVLASADGVRQSAKLLEAVGDLKGSLEKQPFSNLEEFEKQISAAEIEMQAAILETQSVHDELNTFLDTYNQTVNLMSQNFLVWNSLLSDWETAVERRLSKK